MLVGAGEISRREARLGGKRGGQERQDEPSSEKAGAVRCSTKGFGDHAAFQRVFTGVVTGQRSVREIEL
jgi:hypothetical protein